MANKPTHSPAPWGYDYSPYTVRVAGDGDPDLVGKDIPAFEVFDAEGNKVFDTNEDTPAALQEANACLGAAAPKLLSALDDVRATLKLRHLDEASDDEVDEALRIAETAIAEATADGDGPPSTGTGSGRSRARGRRLMMDATRTPTPGPWVVWRLAPDPATYGKDAGKPIITTADGEREITGVIPEDADARLIAAAPAQAIILTLVQLGLMTLGEGEAEFDGVMYGFDDRRTGWCVTVVDAIGWEAARAAIARTTTGRDGGRS